MGIHFYNSSLLPFCMVLMALVAVIDPLLFCVVGRLFDITKLPRFLQPPHSKMSHQFVYLHVAMILGYTVVTFIKETMQNWEH
ncbi:hypothetical protein BDW22DRAFT_344687 [Trametopsis cervina]|nr:hypothetical protein BDW22DRAFT_344687 [Trametopsis cervina]